MHAIPYLGSPPPMRGKVNEVILTGKRVGITPAHAGKSFDFDFSNFPYKDHPRPCGEKWRTAAAKRKLRGSPPPMRGKVVERR